MLTMAEQKELAKLHSQQQRESKALQQELQRKEKFVPEAAARLVLRFADLLRFFRLERHAPVRSLRCQWLCAAASGHRLGLYTTRATVAEIHRVNRNLRRAGQRSRLVSSQHLMRHLQDFVG
jgi:S-adenosylmethionine:diacylglycerol 3-amino-3-carboxypropyl transferase